MLVPFVVAMPLSGLFIGKTNPFEMLKIQDYTEAHWFDRKLRCVEVEKCKSPWEPSKGYCCSFLLSVLSL
ncbi:hypothetical protein U1Q18_005139 [Sarracenia purpurea var. burkii]